MKRIFGKGHEHDGLYYFSEPPSSSPSTSNLQAYVLPKSLSPVFTSQTLELWHARLGHVNFQYLCLLFPSLNKACTHNKFQCVVCELSKHTCSRNIPRVHRAPCAFDIIPYDIWGSFPGFYFIWSPILCDFY